MKRPIILAFALVVSSLFLSCSNDEDIAQPQQSTELFKTFQLKRDATGAYSIEFDSNVNISKIKNSSNNTNELYLSMSNENLTQKSNVQSDLFFNDENFKVNFITQSSISVPSISVFDDNIKFAKKSETTFLKEYSLTKNEDGTYNLDFTVENKVNVDFVYNSEINVHEVHLEEGIKSSENNNYSRVLDKEDYKLLQIHFVNHTNISAKGLDLSGERKPRIIIDTGEGS